MSEVPLYSLGGLPFEAFAQSGTGAFIVAIHTHQDAPWHGGTSPIRKDPPPVDPPRTLGIGLR